MGNLNGLQVCQSPSSVSYLIFLYQEERRYHRTLPDPQYICELKYCLTDELIHTNFSHSKKFTQEEIGHMQDSVLYKKRLKMQIARLKKQQEEREKSKMDML